MDSDLGKLFIGGISPATTEEMLQEHFAHYGEVSHAAVMRDKLTGRSRGFCFVSFSDPSLLDRVLQDDHVIDGRTVEAKRALSRAEQQNPDKSGNPGAKGTGAGGARGNLRTKKIFVGGLPPTLTEEGFCQYFQNYGNVTDVVVMYDQNTQRPRGFGFISFDTEDAVDSVLHKAFHELNGKLVEVKRALPRDANTSGAANRSMGGANYHPYGRPGANASSSAARVDADRHMKPQAASGGYASYGSSGYGAPSYGAYGNPNVPPVANVSGSQGAFRSPWRNQAPKGDVANASWNPSAGSVGASATAPAGGLPSGGAGYASQGYGYGYSGYGGAGGSSGSQFGYGVHGGNQPDNFVSGKGEQGAGYGNAFGGHDGANGNSVYLNAWRPDQSQGWHGGGVYNGGQAASGGHYGGTQGKAAPS